MTVSSLGRREQTPRTDHFQYQKGRFQTNKPLKYHDGRFTYRLISYFYKNGVKRLVLGGLARRRENLGSTNESTGVFLQFVYHWPTVLVVDNLH